MHHDNRGPYMVGARVIYQWGVKNYPIIDVTCVAFSYLRRILPHQAIPHLLCD